jgi:hypothetical protein
MRPLRILLALSAALLGVWLFSACSSQPDIERVDVTWVSLSPSPRWGLYPGYRQEIEYRKGSAYKVDVYSGGKVATSGIVGYAGSSLALLPAPGARDIGSQADGPGRLDIYVTLKDEKGESRRLLCLKVEQKGDKIWFEFPK